MFYNKVFDKFEIMITVIFVCPLSILNTLRLTKSCWILGSKLITKLGKS